MQQKGVLALPAAACDQEPSQHLTSLRGQGIIERKRSELHSVVTLRLTCGPSSIDNTHA